MSVVDLEPEAPTLKASSKKAPNQKASSKKASSKKAPNQKASTQLDRARVAPAGRATRPRPVRRQGGAGTPRLRPASGIPAPTLRSASSPQLPQGCAPGLVPLRPAAPQSTGRPAWRITERGIALVLVAAAMLTVAALAVVVPTALRVTGDNYQPVGTSQGGTSQGGTSQGGTSQGGAVQVARP